ncbi:hypothetical protein AWC26_08910 [Mycobacterium shimoidei]|nr:hypothetical protein BHQ16_04010 [Mycobacterium shimoidei]ORW80976.1 hypothetical protein AWC26_08910 [Mycobacterium shimoidei]
MSFGGAILGSVLKRVHSWATTGSGDPIPTALTVAGCIVSAFALGWGLSVDWRGFALNVAASLTIVGPALFLSNILVKRIQDVRARHRLAPLAQTVLLILHSAVQTTQQALDLLGVDASLDVPSDPVEVTTLQRVKSAVDAARDAIPRWSGSRRSPTRSSSEKPCSSRVLVWSYG